MDIIVYNSKGGIVKELDRAKRLETFLDLDYSDIYTVTAVRKNFIGDYWVKVYDVDKALKSK